MNLQLRLQDTMQIHFCDFIRRLSDLLKKVNIYHYYDRNEIKLSSKYGIALLSEKILKAQRNKF